MALLITGAGGYVGSRFIKRLQEAERADCLTPNRQELDLSDCKSIEAYFHKHQIDRVLHLAASLDNNDSGKLMNSNIIGLYNILRVCKTAGTKYFCFASGNNVYGAKKGIPFKETDAPAPESQNWYGVTKYCGELMVADILDGTMTAYSIIRIGDIYGPQQKTGTLLKTVVENIINAQPQRLYGTGDRIRDYIYIDDVVEGLKHIMGRRMTGIYNLATGKGTSVSEIISTAEKISKCRENTVAVKVEKEDHSKVVLDVSKLEEAGFKAQITFEEGLRRIVEERGKL
jgi:CDP-paratose 2-epimerase